MTKSFIFCIGLASAIVIALGAPATHKPAVIQPAVIAVHKHAPAVVSTVPPITTTPDSDFGNDDDQSISGGLGQEQEADDTVQGLVDKLKTVIIKRICDQPNNAANCPTAEAKIVAVAYKSQVVSGTNYFVKIHINDVHYHARIYDQSWTETLELTDIKGPVEKHAVISYF